MQIILFTHPSFLTSQSMPRFAAMLRDGMKERGHNVSLLTPKSFFFRLPFPAPLKKWLGYIDQYILFPAAVRSVLSKVPEDTLFVFADQALGPWIPLVANRPHVVHCHDFLAQRAAAGQFPERLVSWTGVRYQRYIRKGYLQGRNFISVSKKTQEDLHDFYDAVPPVSEVVYNGVAGQFVSGDVSQMRATLSERIGINCNDGYIMHVGGNQWYKNRRGVVEIYSGWRNKSSFSMPLILIGATPNEQLLISISESGYQNDIHCISGMDDGLLKTAYAGASVFLFPSLAEGFGWPIAEAMASGVPVITTNEAPMTEVAGGAGVFVGKRPSNNKLLAEWVADCASKLEYSLNLTPSERSEIVAEGYENVKRFDAKIALNQIERIYLKVLEDSV